MTSLMTAARLHSEDQSVHRNMSHRGSDGSTVVSRFARQGYTNCYSGETVAYGDGMSAEQVVRLWINSPPHYTIMFNPIYDEVGAGEAGLPPAAGFWTVDFGKRV
jgi:uncharacterized protein YkwD